MEELDSGGRDAAQEPALTALEPGGGGGGGGGWQERKRRGLGSEGRKATFTTERSLAPPRQYRAGAICTVYFWHPDL
jgi:hypothetical protein